MDFAPEPDIVKQNSLDGATPAGVPSSTSQAGSPTTPAGVPSTPPQAGGEIMTDRPASLPIKDMHRAVPLRTLSSDLAEAVRENDGSVVKIAIAEDERRRAEREEQLPTSKKNLTYIIGGILIILAAIGGMVFVLRMKRQSETVVAEPTAPAVSSLVRSDSLAVIDVSGKNRDEIRKAINDATKDPAIRIGTVRNFLIAQGVTATSTRLTASQFLSSIYAHVSSTFSRTLTKDYMVGAYFYNRVNGFIVLRSTAHDYLLSGMLEWEPFMLDDLAPVFGIDMTGDNKALSNKPFTSTIVENRDARAVIGFDQKPVLYYSYLDENTVLIASDPQPLGEAVRRY